MGYGSSKAGSRLLLLQLQLQIPMELCLDVCDALEQLADNLVAVLLERFVDLCKLGLGVFVYLCLGT